ncbi:MAG TPA: carbon-nitrogen hydrolase family protein [Phycisphaerae bacterium]|nr:carbon-nitrogen hydrolase family protein [Phycisphaerae bacterium]
MQRTTAKATAIAAIAAGLILAAAAAAQQTTPSAPAAPATTTDRAVQAAPATQEPQDAEQKENAMAATKPVEGGPRKVIVGTSMFAMWGKYPGLQQRLDQLGSLIDDMAAKARAQHGRSIDIAALPEVAVNAGLPLGPKDAFPLAGAVQDFFAAKCREHHCYIVVPMTAKGLDADAPERAYNICALLGRKGELVGVYRKVHAVGNRGGNDLEGGTMPGTDFPVFQCDFGKVGMQICYDISFDDGWQTLGRKGAELVIWSTQSPGQRKAGFRAYANGYYVLTSTWRNNASLLDPTGELIASITKPEERVLVTEIDLEYLLIPWQPKLENGKAFDKTFGKGTVGYRYSEAEDGGIFWSNDPKRSIKAMAKELGLDWGNEEVERNRTLQDAIRGCPPCLK